MRRARTSQRAWFAESAPGVLLRERSGRSDVFAEPTATCSFSCVFAALPVLGTLTRVASSGPEKWLEAAKLRAEGRMDQALACARAVEEAGRIVGLSI
jgi:hypothetical protein